MRKESGMLIINGRENCNRDDDAMCSLIAESYPQVTQKRRFGLVAGTDLLTQSINIWRPVSGNKHFTHST